MSNASQSGSTLCCMLNVHIGRYRHTSGALSSVRGRGNHGTGGATHRGPCAAIAPAPGVQDFDPRMGPRPAQSDGRPIVVAPGSPRRCPECFTVMRQDRALGASFPQSDSRESQVCGSPFPRASP